MQSQPQQSQAIQPHIAALREKHAWLERKLEEAIRRPAPDEALIRDLKRRKLKLKDELAHA